MGDEVVENSEIVSAPLVGGVKKFSSKTEKILRGFLIFFLVVFFASFFIEMVGSSNLWKGNLWFALIVFLIIISSFVLMYFKKLDGTLLLSSFFAVIYILSIAFEYKHVPTWASFNRYLPMFLGFTHNLSSEDLFLFKWSSLIVLLLSIALLVVYFRNQKKQGEIFKKKMIYSIIVFFLIVGVVFGSLYLHYSIVRMQSNNVVFEYMECSRECPVEVMDDGGNDTWEVLDRYCSGLCMLEIEKFGKAVYPDAFWDLNPLTCILIDDKNRYSECVDYVLDEWEKGNTVSDEDIKAKGMRS